jgi:hypothetical protein
MTNGLHSFRALPPPGDGFSLFSGVRAGAAHIVPGEGALGLLAAIFLARVDTSTKNIDWAMNLVLRCYGRAKIPTSVLPTTCPQPPRRLPNGNGRLTGRFRSRIDWC